MNVDDEMEYGSYDPNHLIDSVLDRMGLADDDALADALRVHPSVIAEIRDMRTLVNAPILLQLHELTGISVIGLRNIMGDRRAKLRYSDGAEENLD
jgi:hypothetical protein